MPYIIPDKRLAVFFAPKSAGTTLRSVLFELENGRVFEPYILQSRTVDANALVANIRFERVDKASLEGFHRIAVIRDPVRRFLSAYSNRVLHYRELSAEAVGPQLEAYGLLPDPDLDTFVERIGRYARASKSIRRHTRGQEGFLGSDTSYYDAVFRVEDLGALPRHLERRFGCPPLTLPRLQTGGPKIRPEDVDPHTLKAIKHHVSGDVAYAFYPAYRDGMDPDMPAAARA